MSRLFEAGAEVLYYVDDQRCYGTVVSYQDDENVVISTVDEDGEPGYIETVAEDCLRDADDPDDPDPNDR